MPQDDMKKEVSRRFVTTAKLKSCKAVEKKIKNGKMIVLGVKQRVGQAIASVV